MLDRKNRISKKKDIEKVLKKGKSFKEGPLILKTLKNDLDFCRFGFIVSQKVSKKAVVRNQIKRKLREIIRLKIKFFNFNNDNLFIFLSGIEKKDKLEIEEIVEKLIKKAKLND